MAINWGETLSQPTVTSVGNPLDTRPVRDLIQERGQLYDQYSKEQMDWARKQFEKNAAMADRLQSQAIDTGSMFKDWAKADRGLYDEIYVPGMRQQMSDAMGWDSPAELAKASGEAAAGANISFDAAADMAKRALMGYGVDPSAGRFAGLDAGLAAKRATAAAGQSNKAMNDRRMQKQSLLANAIRTGQVLPGQAANEAGVSLAAGRQAGDIGLATTASGAQTMGSPWQWSGMGDDMTKLYADTLMKQTQLGMQQNKDAAEERLARDKLAQSSSSGVGAAIGAGAGILGMVANMYAPGSGALVSGLGSMAGKSAGGGGGGFSGTPGFGIGWGSQTADQQMGLAEKGGLIRRFADGGITDVEEEPDSMLPEMMPEGGQSFGPLPDDESMEPMPDNEAAEGDQMVTPDMSPSGGAETDDVPAMLNEGEFVIPKDVTTWKGEQFFQKLIEKARQEMTNKVAEPEAGPPVQAQAMAEPAFASPGTQAARGGRIQALETGGRIGQELDLSPEHRHAGRRRRMAYEDAIGKAKTRQEHQKLWDDYKRDMDRLQPGIEYEDWPPNMTPNYQAGGRVQMAKAGDRWEDPETGETYESIGSKAPEDYEGNYSGRFPLTYGNPSAGGKKYFRSIHPKDFEREERNPKYKPELEWFRKIEGFPTS